MRVRHFFISENDKQKIGSKYFLLTLSKIGSYLWVYVIIPNHVHILIKPAKDNCEISDILQSIKGKNSKRYRGILIEKDPETYNKYCIQKGAKKTFRFWQPGGGYDRNLWNAKAIHDVVALMPFCQNL